ncbi:MAG TPA: hypothetical protein VFA45_21645 [Actinomycetes bacterium]|jgi:hypothetical protein|nr:hypothetical protein [Actinomycetes bacterium]
MLDSHHNRDPGSPRNDPQPATTADSDPAAWSVPSWQWASLVALLLGGQAILLILTTWTLATSAHHAWPLPILLALGLLARLVPDTLRLAEWAALAQTWTPPIHPRLHLATTITALVLAVLVAIAT